jgi:hypothetical protein
MLHGGKRRPAKKSDWPGAASEPIQYEVGMQWSVLAGIADTKNELAGIGGPFVRRLIPVAEGARIERQSPTADFAECERYLFEALEFALGSFGFCAWIGDLKLRNSPMYTHATSWGLTVQSRVHALARRSPMHNKERSRHVTLVTARGE